MIILYIVYCTLADSTACYPKQIYQEEFKTEKECFLRGSYLATLYSKSNTHPDPDNVNDPVYYIDSWQCQEAPQPER